MIEICDLQEAAKLIGIQPQSLHRLLQQGQGPKGTLKNRKWMFRIGDIEEFKRRYDAGRGRSEEEETHA
jgi:predicted site-specific integrase-resolvase